MNNYNDYFNYLYGVGNQQENVNNMNSFNYQQNQSNDSQLVDDPYIGFIRGNMFKNLYSQYKNYKPAEITPENDKDYLRLLVQIYCFAAHDMTLYLDTHPTDSQAIRLRSEYMNLYKESLKDYEKKYGALNLDSETLDKSPWGWETKYWPWEEEY